MGVYIKGMKMPKDCNTCYINDCLLPYSKVVPIGYRHKDCPLVEVKEPHGRLIDAEWYKEHLYQCEMNGRPLHLLDLHEVLQTVDDAPTILDAESEVTE